MRNDYSINYFWKIKNPETQQYRFYLKPNGKLVEVSEDVFKVCYNSYKKLMRDNIRDNQVKLMNLDSQVVDDITYLDVILVKQMHMVFIWVQISLGVISLWIFIKEMMIRQMRIYLYLGILDKGNRIY